MAINTITQPYVRATNAQYSEISPLFLYYSTFEESLGNKFFFDNSKTTPITAVGTATFITENSTPPEVAVLNQSVYSPKDTDLQIPLVTQNRNYVTFTTTGTNAGIKISTGTIDVSKYNFVVIVDKATGTSVAGKLKIRSSVANEAVCAFTTSATANKWLGGATTEIAHAFLFRDTTQAGVTYTGTPVFTSITEIEVTLDAANTASVAMVYFCEDIKQIIGAEIALSFDCLTSLAKEHTVDKAEQMCNNRVESMIPTKDSLMFTLETAAQDLQQIAASNGTTISTKTVDALSIFCSPDINKKTIATNTVSLGVANLNIAKVTIPSRGGNITLQRWNGSAANLRGDCYHLSGTTMTFPAKYNGLVPTVYIFEEIDQTAFIYGSLRQGPIGYWVVTAKTQGGQRVQMSAVKAQLSIDSEAAADEGDKITYKVQVFPDSQGKLMTKTIS